jgi:hypothetical protein
MTICCCTTCGNCKKSPTYDGRTPCCCAACGHCFKRPVEIVDARGRTRKPHEPWMSNRPGIWCAVEPKSDLVVQLKQEAA